MDVDDEIPTTHADERFAAAVDGAATPGAVDPELARELEIVNRLVAQGATLNPEPAERERARRRLWAALEARAADDGPSQAS